MVIGNLLPAILKRTPRRARTVSLKFETPEASQRFEQWLHAEGFPLWQDYEPYE